MALLLCALTFAGVNQFTRPAAAATVYQTPERFLEEAFAGETPQTKTLWITKRRKEAAHQILGRNPDVLRQRYWRLGNQTAWILEEIGKEHPITTGILIDDNGIQRIRVLIYRENRGQEVRHPFFTKQFEGATLKSDRTLGRQIDGISGATLSVRALKRLARLALYLHNEAMEAHD